MDGILYISITAIFVILIIVLARKGLEKMETTVSKLANDFVQGAANSASAMIPLATQPTTVTPTN